MTPSSDGKGRLREAGQLAKPRRLSKVLERLATDSEVRVAGLAEQLGVSTATVRRDLDELEQRRLVTRTHGGAIARGVVFELPLHDRSAANIAEKMRIAEAAAQLVPDGSVVGLTGGTTTTEVARALTSRSSLTVVTNALNIAWELVVHSEIKLVLTGGVARASSYELIGPLAEAALTTLHLDFAFLGADGVSASHGLSTQNEVEAHTNRIMIKRARQVIVVADHSKLGEVRFAQICKLDEVDHLITDRDAAADELEEIRGAGLKVTVA